MKPHIQALINTITTKIFELSFSKAKESEITCLKNWVDVLKEQKVDADLVTQLENWINALQTSPQPRRPVGSMSMN